MAGERVLAIKLAQIEQYHSELVTKRETLSCDGFYQSTTEQRAVERMFENTIQRFRGGASGLKQRPKRSEGSE